MFIDMFDVRMNYNLVIVGLEMNLGKVFDGKTYVRMAIRLLNCRILSIHIVSAGDTFDKILNGNLKVFLNQSSIVIFPYLGDTAVMVISAGDGKTEGFVITKASIVQTFVTAILFTISENRQHHTYVVIVNVNVCQIT